MSEASYWTRKPQANRLSRRRFLGATAGAGAGAAGFALVGCGDDDDDDGNGNGGNGNGNGGNGNGVSPTAAPTSASGTPQSGSYYHGTGATTTFQTVDVHRELFPNTTSYLGLAYSNLVIYEDANLGTLRPDVSATLPEQPEEDTYIFNIREGVKWHNKPPVDGRDFTIEDVQWNFERQMARQDFAGNEVDDFYRHSILYQHVDSVEVVDATHLRVKLKAPQPTWLGNMAHPGNSLMAEEAARAIEPNLNAPNGDLIIGTGPYIFTRFDLGDRFVTERNPDFFGLRDGEPIAFLDRIIQSDLGTDLNAARIAFEQKQIDDYQTSELQVMRETLDATGADHIEVGAPNNNFTMAASFVNPPFADNMDVRMAVHLALDRRQVIELTYEGQARMTSVVPWPYVEWVLPEEELAQAPGYREDKEQDIADARARWEAGGGPALGPIELTLNDTPAWRQRSVHQWLANTLNENLGTDQFSFTYLPTASVLSHIAGPEFDTLLCSWTIWDSPDPRGRLVQDFTPGGALNFPRFENEELTNLANQALAEFDIETAQGLVKDAQRLANDLAGAGKFHMASGVSNILKHPYLHMDYKFVFLRFSGQTARFAWIDQNDPSFANRPSLV